MTHRLPNPRRNVVPYLALLLVLVLGAGGGYALAASKTKTITVCADKKTGVLHLKTRGRCKRSQTRVTWNQQGPQGAQGVQGAAGPQGPVGGQGPQGLQGPAAVSVWAQVAGNGVVFAGQGLSVQRQGQGTYLVTVTDPTCSRETNAPLVGVSDGGSTGTSFPLAWFELLSGNQFMVFTGVFSGGMFSATDHTFDVHDACP